MELKIHRIEMQNTGNPLCRHTDEKGMDKEHTPG